MVNSAKERKNVVIGGHFRLKVAKDLGIKEVPVCYINIPDIEREKELNLRLNRNLGEWDYSLLADFDESLLADVGFTSEELDITFDTDDEQRDTFNIKKELDKLDIKKIAVKKGEYRPKCMIKNSRKKQLSAMISQNRLNDYPAKIQNTLSARSTFSNLPKTLLRYSGPNQLRRNAYSLVTSFQTLHSTENT